MVAYSFKQRFVQPIEHGLRISLDEDAALRCPPKRQTIRANGKKRHARPGEDVQLYTAMRTKQCRKLGEAKCTETAPIIIWLDEKTMAIELSKQLMGRTEMERFARSDGFADAADMADFWRKEHPGVEKFEGVLIKWEPIDG